MIGIHSRTFPVPAGAIDANRHVGNVAWVQWMQDVAIEHSTALGWSMERYLDIGATWVARSHYVEYLRPGLADDVITAHTWIAGLDEGSSPRRYLFVRQADRRVLVRAETRWVWVNAATGRPARIPDEVRAAFTVIADDAEVARALGLRRLE